VRKDVRQLRIARKADGARRKQGQPATSLAIEAGGAGIQPLASSEDYTEGWLADDLFCAGTRKRASLGICDAGGGSIAVSILEQSKVWIEHLAGGIELGAAVIIGLAAMEAMWKALPLFLRRDLSQELKVKVRLSLGRWLALGLEFALAADILRTAVAPTWRDIGQLAAIAVLRTGLNYSLEREIAREEARTLTYAARASSD